MKLGFIDKNVNGDFDVMSLNFSRSLEILSIYRNVCAHNERLYNYSIKVPLDDNFLEFGEKLPYCDKLQEGSSLTKAESKRRNNVRYHIFVLFFLITKFLNKSEIKKFKAEVNKLFKKLDNQLVVISIDDIKREMGLDFNWEEYI